MNDSIIHGAPRWFPAVLMAGESVLLQTGPDTWVEISVTAYSHGTSLTGELIRGLTKNGELLSGNIWRAKGTAR